MSIIIEQMHYYLSALDNAAHAIEQARRIRPDASLDHAFDRLQALMLDGHQALQQHESGDG